MLVLALFLSLHSALAISVVKSYRHDMDALWRVLLPYADSSNVVSAEKLKEAYAAKDKYGQGLSLPPMKMLMEQADENKDGAISKYEAQNWKGYEGKAYCRNLGDNTYGCLERCMGGTERLDGDPSFFDKYQIERKDYPEDDAMQINVNRKYTGAITYAQRTVIKKAIKDLVEKKVSGAYVELGVKDMHSWRLLFDTMTTAGDTTTQVHLYDTFAGFPQCDHAKDTGMCPTQGSGVPNMDALKSDISTYGDLQRVQIHKVPSYENIADLPQKVAFVLVDGAMFPSVSAMLKSVHPRLVKGATVFIHDFGWEGYTGVEKAVAEYLRGPGAGNHVVLPGGEDGAACYLGQINF